MTGRQLLVADLGVVPFVEALALQRALARARISGVLDQDLLILVEHPPVVTLGRSSKDAHLLATPASLAARGVELHEAERGGDITFHGPGQLVGYPIMDLKRHKQDLHWYLRQVEEVLIRALAPLGIVAERNAGFTGVWTGGRKLASIGVHARDWVTWHGFALNVTTDLEYFGLVVPCGIAEVTMTSVAAELAMRGDPPLFDAEAATLPEPWSRANLPSECDLGGIVRALVSEHFGRVFNLEPTGLDLVELERVAAVSPGV